MGERRFALIDLGSNSIRLVLFDRERAFAAPLINEKAVVELGRGLDERGQLAPERIDAALHTFEHFKWLLDGLNVTEIHIIATAAVREATNAQALITRIETLMHTKVQVLDGVQEARLAATGVLLACPGAKGLVADLGGGSLDLAVIGAGEVQACYSLPLGVLRLEAMGLEAAQAALNDQLSQVPWLKGLGLKGKLYLVGGAWRALARAHMAHKAYALNVLHRYTLSTKALKSYAGKITTHPDHRLNAIKHVPLGRRRKLPWAAMAAHTLADLLPYKQAVFSGAGLREGYSADLLGRSGELKQPQSQRYDRAIAALIPDGGRFGAPGQELFNWMSPLFFGEKDALRDRRRQACQLFDFGWEAHPSYRNIDIPSAVLHSATLTQSHRDRAYLGLVLLLRHGGDLKNKRANPWLKLISLLPKGHCRHAITTGWALRLAYKISRGIVPLVQTTSLHIKDLRLILTIHEPDLATMGSAFMPTLSRLAHSLALEPLIISKSPQAPGP